MAVAVFVAAIHLPDISEADQKEMRKKLQVAIYDIFDESGFEYKSHALDFVNQQMTLDEIIDGKEAEKTLDSKLPGFRSGDPDTSRKGAIDAYPRSKSQKWEILIAVYKSGDHGMTYEEVEQATGIKNAHKRISDLKGAWLEDGGERLARLTGSMATIHKVTPKAERFIEQKEKAKDLR